MRLGGVLPLPCLESVSQLFVGPKSLPRWYQHGTRFSSLQVPTLTVLVHLTLWCYLQIQSCSLAAPGRKRIRPQIPWWEMVMFQCPTESHIFQYSKAGHPIANHLAFWAMSSTNFCSNLSLPWSDTIPPLVRWQWKIMEHQWVPHHLVEFCHGTSWLLFGPRNSLDSLIQLGGLVLQPQAETQESYLFRRATATENTWKIHDFKTMWFHGVILPTWQNVNVHSE